MSDDPLQRLADAVAEVTEDEVAAAFGSLGIPKARAAAPEPPRTPLPAPGSPAGIESEMEWV